MKAYEKMTDLIGNTPLLRLGRIAPEAEVYAKCEFMNPLSLKDRPVLQIIEDAEAAGKVRAHREHLTAAFRARLAEAQSSGELGPDKDVGALAEFLTTTAYTLGFLLRAGCDPDYLRRHLRTALSVLR